MGICVSYNEDITTSFSDYTMKFDSKFGLNYDDEEGKFNSIRFITKESMIKSMKSKMEFYASHNISHKIYEIIGDKLIIVFTIRDSMKSVAQLKCVEHLRCISFYKCKSQSSRKGFKECGICKKKRTRSNSLYYMNICCNEDQGSQQGYHLECIQNYIETNPRCEKRIVCPCCYGSLNIEALESFYEQFISSIPVTIPNNKKQTQYS